MKDAILDKIAELKSSLGPDLAIVGHHYQRDDIVSFCDTVGDSLELIEKIPSLQAKYIVFCGVSFMGETAALLARDDQAILLPAGQTSNRTIGMPTAEQVETTLAQLAAKGSRFLPLVYVNAPLELKALAGRHGGALCTSSNLRRMLQWAFKQSQHVLFVPDRNLARNTARTMGMTEEHWQVLDVDAQGQIGSCEADVAAAAARHLLCWPGACSIHAAYTPAMVNAARFKHTGCRILVHSEAAPEVVALSDAAGPTSFLVLEAQNVAKQGKTSVLVVGTELNLVHRLRLKHQNVCTIVPLLDDPCQRDDSAIVQPAQLLACLEALKERPEAASLQEKQLAPRVSEKDRADASQALQRMLSVCA